MSRNYFNHVFVVICILVFAISLGVFSVYYLPIQTQLPFFNRSHFNLSDICLAVVFLCSSGFLLPLDIRFPSTIFAIVIYIFLYIPCVVITLGNEKHINFNSFMLLLCLWFGIVIISSIVHLSHHLNKRKELIYLSSAFPFLFFILWVLLAYVLILEFHSIMHFASLSTLYIQRVLGKADSMFIGYAQTYFGYFCSLVLFSYGLYKRAYFFLFIGLLGCILLYSITAEKTIFLLPMFVSAVYFCVKKKHSFTLLLSVFLLALSLLAVLISLFYNDSKFLYDLGFYSLNRNFTLPGLFISKYYDFFNSVGYTHWANVKGLSYILPSNPSLLQYPEYPSLGRIFAIYGQGIDSDSNASFLATDGVAAAGLMGIIVISVLLSIYLFLVDNLSRYWPSEFIVPAMCPLALILTNGSFFTVLLSFGGFAWIVIFLMVPKMNSLKKLFRV